MIGGVHDEHDSFAASGRKNTESSAARFKFLNHRSGVRLRAYTKQSISLSVIHDELVNAFGCLRVECYSCSTLLKHVNKRQTDVTCKTDRLGCTSAIVYLNLNESLGEHIDCIIFLVPNIRKSTDT